MHPIFGPQTILNMSWKLLQASFFSLENKNKFIKMSEFCIPLALTNSVPTHTIYKNTFPKAYALNYHFSVAQLQHFFLAFLPFFLGVMSWSHPLHQCSPSYCRIVVRTGPPDLPSSYIFASSQSLHQSPLTLFNEHLTMVRNSL